MNLQSNFPIVLWIVAVLVLFCCYDINAQSVDTDFSRSEIATRLADTMYARNFDELIESISDYDGGNYTLAASSAMQPSATGKSFVPIRAILNDPRVSKLYELLAEMPRKEAANKLERVYEQKFAEFKRDWEAGFPLKAHGHPDASQHGLTSTLFLCLEFGGVDLFDRLLQEWFDWFEVARHSSRYLARNAGPDELTIINFYAIALFKRGETLEVIDRRLQQLCDGNGLGPLPELRLSRLFKWDATGARRNGADNVLAEYPVFFNWGSARHLSSASDFSFRASRRAIAEAHDWLWPPSPIELLLESAWHRIVAFIESYFQLELMHSQPKDPFSTPGQ